MKKNNLLEIRKLNIAEIKEKQKQLKSEILTLSLDQSVNKLANIKEVKNKRRDLAQILTILGQKQTLARLEEKNA